MKFYGVHYPGTWLDGLAQEKTRDIESLLRVCEDHLIDAGLALAMFNDARTQLEKSFRGAGDEASDARIFDGELPRNYRHRLPFVHAHTVLYALDGLKRALGVLANEAGLSPVISIASADFNSWFPGLTPVRDSSHHLEDRARGLGRSGKRLKLQPVTTGAINAPGGGFLGIDNLEGDDLCFTGSDGAYHRVAINDANLRLAQSAVQSVLDALTWKGPPRFLP
jgi:hypothetical protein